MDVAEVDFAFQYQLKVDQPIRKITIQSHTMRALILAILLALAPASYAGDFNINGIEENNSLCPWLDGGPCYSGVFEGVIQKGDTEKIALQLQTMLNIYNKNSGKLIAHFKPRIGRIYLSSTGGDVYESLKMGDWFRKNKVTVIVPEESPCYSACVFAFAGGAQRFHLGTNIGLHAFYSSETKNPNFDYDSENIKYQKVEEDIRDYLKRMRIPTALLDDILQTPSASLHILTPEEAKKYGLLVGFDPLFHQLLVAKGYLHPKN